MKKQVFSNKSNKLEDKVLVFSDESEISDEEPILNSSSGDELFEETNPDSTPTPCVQTSRQNASFIFEIEFRCEY